MFREVICDNCGKGQGINYEFSITEWEERCSKCGEQKSSEKAFEFCSLRCSRIYIHKLENHKCSGHYRCIGLDLYNVKTGRIREVWVSCRICRKMESIPYKKGMKVEGLKHFLR